MTFRLSVILSATVSLVALAAAETARAQDGGTTQLEQIDVEGQGQGTRQGGAAGRRRSRVRLRRDAGGRDQRRLRGEDHPHRDEDRHARSHETPADDQHGDTQEQIDDQRPPDLQEALALHARRARRRVRLRPALRQLLHPRRRRDLHRRVPRRLTPVQQQQRPVSARALWPGIDLDPKGPASAIYGASSSAGIIDLVSKRPTDYKFGEFEAQADHSAAFREISISAGRSTKKARCFTA